MHHRRDESEAYVSSHRCPRSSACALQASLLATPRTLPPPRSSPLARQPSLPLALSPRCTLADWDEVTKVMCDQNYFTTLVAGEEVYLDRGGEGDQADCLLPSGEGVLALARGGTGWVETRGETSGEGGVARVGWRGVVRDGEGWREWRGNLCCFVWQLLARQSPPWSLLGRSRRHRGVSSASSSSTTPSRRASGTAQASR